MVIWSQGDERRMAAPPSQKWWWFLVFSPWPLFRGGEKAGDDNLLFSSVSPDCGGGGGMDAALRSRKYANFSFKTYPFLK